MSVSDLFKPLALKRGRPMPNRFMLAPLTNQQSEADGTVSDYDREWIKLCADGGYGLIQTCATTVQATGIAFPGQLGVHDDGLLPGLRDLAGTIRDGGALSAIQLHHAGHRARRELGGVPAPASDHPLMGLTAMSVEQIQGIRDSFIEAALRTQAAGFDGVAVHGAFGWVLSEFISPQLNQRKDSYGGSLANRSRLLFEVINGIRAACRSDFQIGLRLSVERYGLRIEEIREVAAEALAQGQIDYLDLALWDSQQLVMDGVYSGRTMLSLFTGLSRGDVRVGTAGKINSASRAAELLDQGCDFVLIGRAAILEPDFPKKVAQNSSHRAPATPVSSAFLEEVGISPPFLEYMHNWDGFVRRDAAA